MRIIASLVAVAVVTALTFALVIPVGTHAQAGAAQLADAVLIDGKILTVDRVSSTREALAIRDGRIVEGNVSVLADAHECQIQRTGVQ